MTSSKAQPIKSNFKLIVLHTLVWAALLGWPYLTNHQGHPINNAFLPVHFFTITHLLHASIFYLNAYWLQPWLFNKGRKWQFTWAILALLSLSFVMKMLLLQSGVVSIRFEPSHIPMVVFPDIFFLLFSITYRMVIDKSKLENEKLKMDLKFLRSQVNPHFLFNTMNNMVSLARKKSDQLEPALIKLSGLMRYMVQEFTDKKVPLVKEVEYLESYIELQRMRFNSNFPINLNIQSNDSTHQIEPMLLIPFVENAFKHGITSIENAHIDIALSVQDEILSFRVENIFDNEKSSKDAGSGIGLENVQKRLELLYPNRHHLEVKSDGNVFKIHLKLTL